MGRPTEGVEEVRRRRAAGFTLLLGASALAIRCTPELGEVPFACSESDACPDGYACVSGLCVTEGTVPAEVRVMRITWINSGEMYWFERPEGGASLVVNDGFTPGLRGLYEIDLGSDGSVGEPRLMLDLAEDYPTSTSVISLGDDYGVVTMRFPAVDESSQLLRFRRVPKDAGAATVVFEDQVPFVGGTEPAYVSALARDGAVDICFSDATGGGQFTLLRLDANGEVERRLSLGLPSGVLPLSGDCHMWPGEGELFVRIGLDAPIVYRVSDAATLEEDVAEPIFIDGLPVFADASGILGVSSDASGGADLIVFDWSGTAGASTPIGFTQDTLEIHTAVRSADGELLLAPTSGDAGFATMGVLDLAQSSPAPIASIDRTGTDDLYSGRAFRTGGRTYLAWTALHEDLMDLWIATAE